RKQQVEAADVIAKLEADTMTKQQRMQKELARFNLAADTAGIDPERRARLEAAIREKYTEKKTGDSGLAKARLGEELADIRSAEQERQSVYRQSEAVIEAERRAGLLNEEAYFEARRSLAEGDTQSRISALQQEILVMSRFKGTATEEAQVRKDIATAAGRIGQASAEAIGRDLVLRTQQTAALNAQKRALVELQQAADAEYEALKRRLGVQVRETGTGSRRAGEEAQLEATAAEFTRRQNQLDAEYRNGRLRGREDQYRKELTLLITEEGKQLRAIKEFQRRKRDADADYRNGLSRGIQNVIDGTFETANRTARLTEDAFTGLGDALTDVFTKGKADWGSLEQTILSGITRIIVEQQLIRPIAQFLQGGSGGFLDFAGSILGNLLGGATGGSGMPDGVPTRGGRAMGGPVQAGGLYPVNELARHGPGEILTSGGRQYLMARQDGYVQPMTPASSGMQVVNNFHITGPVDRRTQQQIATAAGRGAQQAMARNG
ncbi:MAG TPA: phage tail tape measure C-terminal domain-containing protein, partial [Ottowia sp.]|nr:phage tail tape measure C-terminal domain-containing protein [Ottowia sp.]